MTQGIAGNLGRIAECGQFFVYKMLWNAERGKYDRKYPQGAPSDAGNWRSYADRLAEVDRLNAAAEDGVLYAVGLWITRELGVFLLDMDGFERDWELDDRAQALVAMLPGAMLEWSSSRRGAHVIGSYVGKIEHRSAPKGLHLELYTHDRGVALSNAAWGSADVDCTDALHALVERYFKPVPTMEQVGTPVVSTEPDLAAMATLQRQVSMLAGTPSGERNHALNTASYLVGGLVASGRLLLADARAALLGVVHQAGWDNLDKCERTIDAGLRSGANTPIPLRVPDQVLLPLDPVFKVMERVLDAVSAAGSYDEIFNTVIPMAAQAVIPVEHQPRVMNAINRKLEFFDAKLPVAKLRAMLNPPRQVEQTEPGEWVYKHCYVAALDKFYDVQAGTFMSRQGFDAQYNRMMPFKAGGKRESAAEWSIDRWGITVVADVAYRPDMPPYFTHGGREYANTFTLDSVPHLQDYTPAGLQAIAMFQRHMVDLCGGRDEIYQQLLGWMAHNVQHPGVKIRWAPLIKGVQGDGKSIIADVLRAAMGVRNIKTTGPSTLTNNGGFTDWASGACVNFIEEIRLEGKARHALFNAMKTYIGDRVIDINAKGRANTGSIINVTNHFATTNFEDALPVDDDDRRWLIVFTPYNTIGEAMEAKGVDMEGFIKFFKTIGDACRNRPGEFRRWLLSVNCGFFDPDSRALNTDDKKNMVIQATDDADDFVADVISKGGSGIAENVVSSKMLLRIVKNCAIYENVEIPYGWGWNKLLGRLGYRKITDKWWYGKEQHRVWVKRSFKGSWEAELTNSFRFSESIDY